MTFATAALTSLALFGFAGVALYWMAEPPRWLRRRASPAPGE